MKFTISKWLKDTTAKFVAQFPTQLSVWWLERKRETYDRNIQIREWNKKGPTPHSMKRELGLPINLLPNVRIFKISLKTFDFIFKMFGIDRKHKPVIDITPLSKTNYQMNRYVVYQFKRMMTHPKKWMIGKILIKRSYSFRLMALKQVHPNWWRSSPFKAVLSLLSQVQKIASEGGHLIDYRRVYIPKANGKLRPLGVPTMAWRIYLHQWQCVTYWNVRHILSAHQHGFQPRKGVLSAWKQIFEEVIHRRNIYEFDLKGFFDNIDWVMIQRGLMKAGAPNWVQDYFRLINCSRPKIAQPMLPERTLDRTELDKRHNELADLADFEFETNLNWQIKPGQSPFQSSVSPQGFPAEEWFFHNIVDGYVDEKEVMKAYWFQPSKAEQEHDRRVIEEYNRGVPQGSGLSPILAILALELEFMPMVTVQYADDGLIASDEPQVLHLDDYTKGWGIEDAEDKSGFIKKDGIWLKPLKFLGMEYDGITDTFRAKTRNGATLEFGSKEQAMLSLESHLSSMKLSDFIPTAGSAEGMHLNGSTRPMAEMVNRASWETLLGSKYYGLFFSRMQCDSWNLTLDQDFSLNGEKFTKHSWLWNKDVHELGPILGELPNGRPTGNGKGWQSVGLLTRPVVKYCWLKLKDWGIVKVNLFNASSFAYHDLARILRKRAMVNK